MAGTLQCFNKSLLCVYPVDVVQVLKPLALLESDEGELSKQKRK